jgi:hypothetical protein
MSTVPPTSDELQPPRRYFGNLHTATVMAWEDGLETPLDPSISGLDTFLSQFIWFWQGRITGPVLHFQGEKDSPPRIPRRLMRLAEQARKRAVGLLGPVVNRAESLHAVVREWSQHGDVPSEQVMVAWEQARQLEDDACAAKLEIGLYPNSLWPGNLVWLLYSPPGSSLRMLPHRIYLDVTDAQLKDVRDVWTLVEWHQASLALDGHSQKRPRGNLRGPRSPKVRRLVARAKEIGEATARDEYLAQFPSEHGHRRLERDWWKRTVSPHIT